MVNSEDIEDAFSRIGGAARTTPFDYSHMYSNMTGADIFLKLENTQRTGSFKIRGAMNKIRQLTDEQLENGVVTASAGNHAQGVALAASKVGTDSTIIMPRSAPKSKVNATEYYGGEVILHGCNYNEAKKKAKEIADNSDKTYIPAFNDEQIIAGQGTTGLEMLSQSPDDLDKILVPIGGGGLIAGIATIVDERSDAEVIGVEDTPSSKAAQSLKKGVREQAEDFDTIADGIATKNVGEKPFEIMKDKVDDVVTVTDTEISEAILYALERSKTLLEGAGAVPLAALLSEKVEVEEDEKVALVLSGGNIDMTTLPNIIRTGLEKAGRYTKLKVTADTDNPDAVKDIMTIITDNDANIQNIHHSKSDLETELSEQLVTIGIETKDRDQIESIKESLKENGFGLLD